MNRILLSAVLAAGLGLSGAAFANPISDTVNSVQFGITGSNINYMENTPGIAADTENGIVPGFSAAISGTPDVFGLPLYTRLSYSQSGGNIEYKQGKDVRTVDDAHFYNIGAELGVPFMVSRDVAVIPYVAGGYRNWSRNLQGSGGYNEIYQNEYAGLGVHGYYALSNRFVVGVDAEADLITGAHLRADLAKRALPFAFDNSGQESLGLKVDYRLNKTLGLYGGVKYTHLDYTGGPINLKNAGLFSSAREPSSQTNTLTVSAGIRAYF